MPLMRIKQRAIQQSSQHKPSGQSWGTTWDNVVNRRSIVKSHMDSSHALEEDQIMSQSMQQTDGYNGARVWDMQSGWYEVMETEGEEERSVRYHQCIVIQMSFIPHQQSKRTRTYLYEVYEEWSEYWMSPHEKGTSAEISLLCKHWKDEEQTKKTDKRYDCIWQWGTKSWWDKDM